MKKKTLLTICALVLVVALSVAGTVAYLTAETEAKVNTFTFGTITIKLDETYIQDSKIYPGAEIEKKPVVSVVKGSEPCYVYAKIVNGFGTYATLDISTDWTLLAGSTNVYRYNDTVDAVDAAVDVALPALFTTVTIDGNSVTSANIAIVAGNTITVDAFAYQSAGVAQADADAAAVAHFAA